MKKNIKGKSIENTNQIYKNEDMLSNLYDKDLLSNLYEKKKIILFLENYSSNYLINLKKINIIDSDILKIINEKFGLIIKDLLSINWNLISLEEFKKFINYYDKYNLSNKDSLLFVYPIFNVSQMRFLKKYYNLTSKSLKLMYEKPNHQMFKIYNIELLNNIKLSSIFELKKDGFISIFDNLRDIIYCHQEYVFLYLKNTLEIKHNFSNFSIINYFFTNGSYNNFVEIFEDTKKNETEENFYIIICDLLSKHYLSDNLDIKKVKHILRKTLNPLLLKNLYINITNEIIFQEFMIEKKELIKEYEYDLFHRLNIKSINGKLLILLSKYNLINWSLLTKLEIKIILGNLFYNGANKNKKCKEENIQEILNKLFKYKEEFLLYLLTQENILKDIINNDMFISLTKIYFHNPKMLFKNIEDYDLKVKEFLLDIEKDKLLLIKRKDNNDILRKKRI